MQAREFFYQSFWAKSITIFSVVFVCVFVQVITAHAQIESIENGAIMCDRNSNGNCKDSESESDDEDEENEESENRAKLSKDKYTPENLVAQTLNQTTIQLTWSDHARGEDAYEAQRRIAGGAWRTIARMGRNTESYTDQGLASGTHYSYRVRAFDSHRQTQWSNEASRKTNGLSAYEKAQEEQKIFVTTKTKELTEQIEIKLREEFLDQKASCDIGSVPEKQVDTLFAERCAALGGTLDRPDDTFTDKFFVDAWHNSRARLFAISVAFFIIINNVIWHIKHRTIRHRLNGER